MAIQRDDLGVPHIRAGNERDALFGLGFVHAQDRLFQMDGWRRAAWGELSPWLGDDYARYDAFVRALGQRQRAAELLGTLPPEHRALVEAYAADVNAGAASLPARPVEYRMLEVEFEPWQPEDAYATLFLQSWNLASNPYTEANALSMADMDPELLSDLLRQHGSPVLDEPWRSVRELDIAGWSRGYQAWDDVLGAYYSVSRGSNAWVVGPERTVDGSPILASDPHLGQEVPSIWYLADVKGGDLHVAGASMPGLPGVVIGHNGSVAWGVTNINADYVDLAILQRDGPDAVILDGRSHPLRRVEGTATLSSGEEVHETVAWTDIGPVVSTLDAPHVAVLQWHFFAVEDQSLEMFGDLARAGDVQSAADSLRKRSWMGLNFVLGDTSGGIAWQQFGTLPLRAGHTGRLPYLASAPGSGWVGWLPDLPGERDPARGYLVSANQRPADPRADSISVAYSEPWRHDRLAELIEGASTIDADVMATMQLDVFDLRASSLLPELLQGVEARGAADERCLEILRRWDYQVRADSVGATVWAVFQRELLRMALADDVPAAFFSQAYLNVGFDLLTRPGWARFFAPPRDVVEAAASTCDILSAEIGSDPEAWVWGRYHPLRLEHTFASEAPELLARWNMREVGVPGNGYTVANSDHGYTLDEMPVEWMSSLRLVMPLGDLAASRAVHPGGQSGQPGHRFYASHFEAHVEGKHLPLYYTDADVARGSRYLLRLEPR